jgi:hypothetical protein
MRFLAAFALAAAIPAQVLVYDNGTFVTNPTGGSGGAPISELETTAPNFLNVLGFNANNAAAVRQTDDFTVNSSLSIDEIEVFMYNTNQVVPSCTGVFVSIFDGNPATGTPNQLIPGAGALVNLIGAPGFTVNNTLTGIFRVTTTTLLNTARNIQSVRITLPATLTLGQGTYYIQYSFTGATTPFFPPLTALKMINTGDAQQLTTATYAALQQTQVIPPATVATPVPNGFQGIPFKFYGPATALPGAITSLGGGCSAASLDVKGFPVVGGRLRADLSNVNPAAFGAIILGAVDQNLPAGVCSCVFHPTLDFISLGNTFDLTVPMNGSLIAVTLYVQGTQLDLIPVGGITNCNLFGLQFDMTDGFEFRLNIN